MTGLQKRGFTYKRGRCCGCARNDGERKKNPNLIASTSDKHVVIVVVTAVVAFRLFAPLFFVCFA